MGLKGSNGFVERFKKRYSIKFKTMHGEAADVNLGELAIWLENVLAPILRRYAPENIFNIDEFGLFWRLLPNKTLTFSSRNLCLVY